MQNNFLNKKQKNKKKNIFFKITKLVETSFKINISCLAKLCHDKTEDLADAFANKFEEKIQIIQNDINIEENVYNGRKMKGPNKSLKLIHIYLARYPKS